MPPSAGWGTDAALATGATTQASLCLGYRVGRRERTFNLGKLPPALRPAELRPDSHRLERMRVGQPVLDRCPGLGVLFADLGSAFFQVMPDRFRRPVSLSYGVNDRCWSTEDVSGGKYSAKSRHRCFRIDDQMSTGADAIEGLRGQEVEIRFLTDGGQNSIRLYEKLAAGNLDRSSTAAGVRVSQTDPEALESGQTTVLGYDACGGHEKTKLDAFRLGSLDLLCCREKLLAIPTVEDRHRVGAQSQRRARCLDSRRAATDDNDTAANRRVITLVDAAQEGKGVFDFGAFFGAFDSQLPAALSPYGEQCRCISVAQDALEFAIRTDPAAGLYLDARPDHYLDFCIQYISWQAILGNAVTQHSAGLGLRLENSDRKAGTAQVVRCRQARGARSDDGDPLGPYGLGKRLGLRR
jgi:hypothetical protein